MTYEALKKLRVPVMQDWENACKHAGVEAHIKRADMPMTKDLFVRYYVLALLLQHPAMYEALLGERFPEPEAVNSQWLIKNADQLPMHGECEYMASDKIRCTSGEGSEARELPADPQPSPTLLRRFSYSIDTQARWRSYIPQELDLTDRSALSWQAPVYDMSVRAVLLDTTQYQKRPRPGMKMAGVVGALQDDQLNKVAAWLTKPSEPVHTWILIGHHPYGTLDSDARSALDALGKTSLDALGKTSNVRLYGSAHGHTDQYLVSSSANGGDVWLELNVGSILQWPMEFRHLQLMRTGEDHRWVLLSPHYKVYDEFRQENQNKLSQDLRSWEPTGRDDDFYFPSPEALTQSSDPDGTEDRRKLPCSRPTSGCSRQSRPTRVCCLAMPSFGHAIGRRTRTRP